jgi:hypothetical protein
MPNPNAVVSSVARFDPPLERSAAELMRGERGLWVELGNGRRARLDPGNARSAGMAQILEGARKQGVPVYLEIDPVTSAITRLLIPSVARVASVRVEGDRGLAVEVEPSHARHTLRRDSPDYGELEKRLREAMDARQVVILTEDEAHNILDVRAFTPGPDGPLPPLPPFPRPEPPKWPWPFWWLRKRLLEVWWWKWWPWWWWKWWCCCVSATKAQQVFDAMKATSCDPLAVPPPCIPFLYPDDGCWARAHEMCRLMITMGLNPRKVWIQASTILHAKTKNNPNCYVEWGWHVAPTLCVRGPKFFQTDQMVIDPSLFTTPVTKATWKGVQGDPNATLTDTDASIYYWGNQTDPAYTQTNYYLGVYRLKLQTRALQVGPPPYAYCP